jgi:hypothetical protein
MVAILTVTVGTHGIRFVLWERVRELGERLKDGWEEEG